jgi:hypothetical protein
MSSHKIAIASPPDRDKLVAMIDFGNEQWAEINQGLGELVLEIYPRRDGKPWVFDFKDAITALERARERLIGTNSCGSTD